MTYERQKLSGRVAELTRTKWRDFGFHYISDHAAKEWVLTGARIGLLKYADMLEEFAMNPCNAEPGEHEHFGPHSYLTVRVGPELWLDEDSVGGSLADIARLAEIVRRELADAAPGDSIRVREEYAPDAEWSIRFEVREDDFDPSSLDWQLN